MSGSDDGRPPVLRALARWSERKRQAAIADDRAPLPPRQHDPTTPAEAPADAAPVLPDLASLDAASDFTAFLDPAVPDDLRNQALRILWRSDPVLANRTGLVDYDDDYTAIGTVATAVRTAFDAVRGYAAAGTDEAAVAATDDQRDAAAAPDGSAEAELVARDDDGTSRQESN